jgi:hypothetical protein
MVPETCRELKNRISKYIKSGASSWFSDRKNIMLLRNTILISLPLEIYSRCLLLLDLPLAYISTCNYITFILYHLKNFELQIFVTFSNPILNIYYILQYLHLDVRRDFFHNIHGTAIYISHSEYVLSLKMTCRAEILLLLITYR